MEAAVEFKKRIAGAGIFGVVIFKLNYWQKAYRVILLSVHKGSEICFYFAIWSFYLAIGLRIKSCRESSLNA